MTENGHDILQLVYTSHATSKFGDDALLNLLKRARRYNAAKGITGVLIVHDDFFAQCLEGSPMEVAELFGRIEHDGRHHGVVVVLEQRVAERSFPGWSMGCTRVSESETVQLSTVKWEAFEQGARAISPGFILLQSLWSSHKASVL